MDNIHQLCSLLFDFGYIIDLSIDPTNVAKNVLEVSSRGGLHIADVELFDDMVRCGSVLVKKVHWEHLYLGDPQLATKLRDLLVRCLESAVVFSHHHWGPNAS